MITIFFFFFFYSLHIISFLNTLMIIIAFAVLELPTGFKLMGFYFSFAFKIETDLNVISTHKKKKNDKNVTEMVNGLAAHRTYRIFQFFQFCLTVM